MAELSQDLDLFERTRDTLLRVLYSRWASVVALSFFSLAYFTQTFLRSWQKRFWFDELCTYYICRQPTFRDSWAAVMHGADFNPPLFYLIQRADAAVFGFGTIGFRMPQILAFWILSLCLFFIVRRSAGVLGGFTAMALPLLSGAYFYAYEARPHGLVLGFAGLAVVCWFHLLDRPGSPAWLTGFALSLGAAFFVHCYALVLVVPFGLVELVRVKRSRAIDWPFWLALLLPVCVAAVAFVPLLHDFHSNMQGTTFISVFPPGIGQFSIFYKSLLQPCILVLLFALLALAADSAGRSGREPKQDPASIRRWWMLALAFAFLGLPLYGILLGKAVHGPFFARYFISAIIGVSIALGCGIGWRQRSPASVAAVLLVTGLVTWSTALVTLHSLRGAREMLVEPSSTYLIDTDRHDNLATYALLTRAQPSLPIAIPGNLDLLYLVHYWPEARSRIFQVVTATDTTEYRTTIGLIKYCHLDAREPVLWRDFLRTHREFLVYSSQHGNYALLTDLLKQGAAFRNLELDSYGSFLADVQMPPGHDAGVER